MKESLKKRWIEALRSGKYAQGRGALRCRRSGADRYCCLGVLCDLVDGKSWYLDDGELYDHPMGDAEQLSLGALRAVGLSEAVMHKLISFNDARYRPNSFKQIADILEGISGDALGPDDDS